MQCAKCEEIYGARTPLASFDEDLAKLPAAVLANASPEAMQEQKMRIAKRNIAVGVVLLIFGFLVPLFFFVIEALQAAPGIPIFLSAGCAIAGLDRLIRGFFQYRSLKRSGPGEKPAATTAAESGAAEKAAPPPAVARHP
jgi:predicted dinucleotide-utilizing enzyme